MVKYLISLFMALLIIGCNKEENCPAEIRIPYWVSPIKSEYKLGDTIEISSKFSSKIRDKNGNLFNFGENEWINNLYIVALDTIYEKGIQTSTYIEIIVSPEYALKHYFSETSDDYEGKYIWTADSLFFRLKMILIKPGVITSYIGLGTGPPKEASLSCRNGWTFDPPFKIKMNDGINYNLEAIDDIDTSGNNYIIKNPDEFNKSGGFLMKIVQ